MNTKNKTFTLKFKSKNYEKLYIFFLFLADNVWYVLAFRYVDFANKNPLIYKRNIKVLVLIPNPILDSKKDVTQINLSYCLQLEPAG
jgi:hypothetical protein